MIMMDHYTVKKTNQGNFSLVLFNVISLLQGSQLSPKTRIVKLTRVRRKKNQVDFQN